MAGVKLKLGMPAVAARIDAMHARERDGWRKSRLLAVKLAARGEFDLGGDCRALRDRPRPSLCVAQDRARARTRSTLGAGQAWAQRRRMPRGRSPSPGAVAGQVGGPRVRHRRAGAALAQAAPPGGPALY